MSEIIKGPLFPYPYFCYLDIRNRNDWL